MAGGIFARMPGTPDDNPEEDHDMAGHDENFKDDSGLLAVFLGLAVLLGMSALPATIGWIQLATG